MLNDNCPFSLWTVIVAAATISVHGEQLSLMDSYRCYNHYENMPMQLPEIFLALTIENFQLKNFDIFLIFAQNIDCGYTLEPLRRGGSNEYPQSMFWSKNKKNRYIPANPSYSI